MDAAEILEALRRRYAALERYDTEMLLTEQMLLVRHTFAFGARQRMVIAYEPRA